MLLGASARGPGQDGREWPGARLLLAAGLALSARPRNSGRARMLCTYMMMLPPDSRARMPRTGREEEA